MPVQHNQASSVNRIDRVTSGAARWPREAEEPSQAEGAPLPRSMPESRDSRPGVAQPMNDHDQGLQNDLVRLLSTLEHQCTRLEKAFQQSDAAEVVNLARAMVDEIVRVGQRLKNGGDDAALTTALAEAGDLYTTLDRLRREIDPSLVRSVLSLFGRSTASRSEKRQQFRQILTDTVRVVETLLHLFGGEFQRDAPAQEWGQASGLFVHELRRVVEQQGTT
jgi:hypothetical protein